MSRYYVRSRSLWVADETYCEVAPSNLPTVSDHQPIDTGLLNSDGEPILRAPNPMGFGKDEEW